MRGKKKWVVHEILLQVSLSGNYRSLYLRTAHWMAVQKKDTGKKNSLELTLIPIMRYVIYIS